jgi:hypothetical protein
MKNFKFYFKLAVTYLTLIYLMLLTQGCSKVDIIPLGHEFNIDARLEIDESGYYHLQLGNDWQTLHRISGTVSEVYNDYDLTRIEWESSHYWIIGDTLGYVVHQNMTLNDSSYLYMTNDTTYVTWFNGFEVPTINKVSYGTMEGEINTMFAPVQSMQGDTIQVIGTAFFADGHVSEEKSIDIVIE